MPKEEISSISGSWIHIKGNDMLCGLWRMTNTLQSSNNSKVWNSEASTQFRTEAVRDKKQGTCIMMQYR